MLKLGSDGLGPDAGENAGSGRDGVVLEGIVGIVACIFGGRGAKVNSSSSLVL